MKRTCTVLLTGPDPLILATMHGRARKTRRDGIVFDSATAEIVGKTDLAPGTPLLPTLYARTTARFATEEFPAIEWQV